MGNSSSSSQTARSNSQKWLEDLPDQIRLWTRIILVSARAAYSPESQLVASSISFFTFLSLFPLTLLIVAVGSRWLDPLIIERGIIEQLEFVVPGLQSLLGDNLETLASSRTSITSIALVTLLWSASGMFNTLTRVMDRLWGTDINNSRSIWRHRGLAILSALVISTILLVVATVEGTAVTILNSVLPAELEPIKPLTTQLWSILISIVLFAALYYFLPHIKLSWRNVLPGAVLAGLFWEVAKRFFLLFIGTYLSRSNLVYGSVATVIAFLMWTYVSGLILLFGAYVNRERYLLLYSDD